MAAKTAQDMELVKEIMYKIPIYNDLAHYLSFFS
jgi:hypothetical protein